MALHFRLAAFIGGAALIVSTSLASAADLSVKAPAYAAPYNWTGVYVGGHLGGGWANQDATFLATDGVALDPVGTTYKTDHSGFLGGLQAGYNYQIQNWVLGIGGDISWTNASTTTTTNGTLFPSVISTQSKSDWLATLTGRVGCAWENWLLCVQGGAAWTHEVYGGNAVVGGVTTAYGDVSDTRSGWTIGTGVEWAFSPKWSVFAEYDYLDFGTKTYSFIAPGATSTYDVKTRINVAKAGINLRF